MLNTFRYFQISLERDVAGAKRHMRGPRSTVLDRQSAVLLAPGPLELELLDALVCASCHYGPPGFSAYFTCVT